MPITIGGFEYENLADIEQWPSFAEWYERENGFPPMVIGERLDSNCRELFEAYIAGAYWEYQQRVAALKTQATATALRGAPTLPDTVDGSLQPEQS